MGVLLTAAAIVVSRRDRRLAPSGGGRRRPRAAARRVLVLLLYVLMPPVIFFSLASAEIDLDHGIGLVLGIVAVSLSGPARLVGRDAGAAAAARRRPAPWSAPCSASTPPTSATR